MGCEKPAVAPQGETAAPTAAAAAQTNDSKTAQQEGEKPAVAQPTTPELRIFEVLEFDGKAPAGQMVEGTIDGGLRWKDNTGENVVVFAKTSEEVEGEDGPAWTTKMTATQFRQADGGWRELRKYTELIDRCEFDTRAEFRTDKSWSITDIDQDGVAEATWVWFSTCTSDVSPATKKVMMTIGDQKYPIRGNTRVDIGGGELIGGEYNIDPAFQNLDVEFLDHAKSAWEKAGN